MDAVAATLLLPAQVFAAALTSLGNSLAKARRVKMRGTLWGDSKARRCSHWSVQRFESAYLKAGQSLAIHNGDEFEKALLLQGGATLDKTEMEEFLRYKAAQKAQGSAGSSTDAPQSG